MSALVFDLGGTYLRAAVAEQGRLAAPIQKTRLTSFDDGAAPAAIWDSIIAAVLAYARTAPVPAAAPMVLAMPGPVSGDGMLLDAPTLVGNDGTIPDLRALLKKESGRDVYLLNDMSAAAWQASRETEAPRFLVVTVSSGIGSKIFDRGAARRVLDDLPFAGEIGHLTVDASPDAPRCDCGGTGHLGAIASGRGINRAARRRAAAAPGRFLASLCVTQFGATVATLANEAHLAPALLAGDPWALGVLEDCLAPLARVITTVVMAVGIPQVVIIGGFAQALGDVFLQTLQAQIAATQDYAPLRRSGAPALVAPPPSEEVCLLGAAVFAHEMLGC